MTEVLSLESTIARDKGQTFTEIDGEIVMLSMNKGEYFTLNEVASRIWEEIENPTTVNQLIERLLSEYDVDRNTCEKETIDCLKDFQMKGILHIKV